MIQSRCVHNLHWMPRPLCEDVDFSCGSLAQLDSSACTRELVLHIAPYSAARSSHFRSSLAQCLLSKKSLRVCWWCPAYSAAAITASLQDLCDALDPNLHVSRFDDYVGCLNLLFELQRDWIAFSLIVLDHATSATASDFLSRSAPRWGQHIVVIPSCPMDELELGSYCRHITPITGLVESIDDDSSLGAVAKRLCPGDDDSIDLSWIVRIARACQNEPRVIFLLLKMLSEFKLTSFELYQKWKALLSKANGSPCGAMFSLLASMLPEVPRNSLWGIVALPPVFPAILFDPAAIDALLSFGVLSFLRSRQLEGHCGLLLVEEWVRRGLVSVAGQSELHAAVSQFCSRIDHVDSMMFSKKQRSEAKISTSLVNSSECERLWRRWRPVTVEHLVSFVRRSRLFFPQIGAYEVSEASQAKFGLPSLPPLPADGQWPPHTVEPLQTSAQDAMLQKRFLEAARYRELQLAIYLQCATDEFRKNDLLLLCIHLLCKKLSQLYISAKLCGVGENYEERALSLLKAVGGSRRDNPSRAIILLSHAIVSSELSVAEERRVECTRQATILENDPTGGQMQLTAQVKAEVDRADYLKDAVNSFSEASRVLQDTPLCLSGNDVSLCHQHICMSLAEEHRDKEALSHAELAFEAQVACVRGNLTTASRPKMFTVISQRDEIMWVQRHCQKFLRYIEAGDYDECHHMLDQTALLAHCADVPSIPDSIVFGASTKHSSILLNHIFPTPILYHHLQLFSTFTDCQIAKHHGLDWEASPVRYRFPAHVLLQKWDSHNEALGLKLLQRLLDSGTHPNTCSPHDMKTILHVAVEMGIHDAIQILVKHPLVNVEYRPPYALVAVRKGLSTAAKVERKPHPLPSALCLSNRNDVMLQLLLEGQDPQGVFMRNAKLIVENLCVEDCEIEQDASAASRLKSLFDETSGTFRTEVVTILLDEGISPRAREQVAMYCPTQQLDEVVVGLSHVGIVRILVDRLCAANDPIERKKKLKDIASHFIHENNYPCATCIIDQTVGFDMEILFWEDALKYRQMKSAAASAESART